MFERVRQEVVLSESRVIGSFRHRDVFQLLPAPRDAPHLEYVVGHHPCILEFKHSVRETSETQLNPEVPGIQDIIELDDSHKRRREVLLLLSTFCNSRVFQYQRRGINTHRWFVATPKDAKDTEGVGKLYWGSQGYGSEGFGSSIERFTVPQEPPITFVEKDRYFNTYLPGVFVIGQTPETFEMPENIHALFDYFYGLTEDAQLAFLSACYYLDKSVELAVLTPSLAFAACVTAIETLSAFDHHDEAPERCHHCGQEIYHAGRKFRDFVAANGSSSPEFRKFADQVYDKRSKVLHRGQLTFCEVEPWTLENSSVALGDADYRRRTASFFRICLVNWLAKTR